ncbi:hypothetical protein FGX00_03500, partial [Xylella fastidiosa subsp. multiplex]|nr:hypothetical protein [Xylella fastidiosa subsp. multiplex]
FDWRWVAVSLNQSDGDALMFMAGVVSDRPITELEDRRRHFCPLPPPPPGSTRNPHPAMAPASDSSTCRERGRRVTRSKGVVDT